MRTNSRVKTSAECGFTRTIAGSKAKSAKVALRDGSGDNIVVQISSFAAAMTPKEELVIGSILVPFIVPFLAWATRRDIQNGESTITGMWTPPWKPVRRDENPSAFWQRIFYFSFGILAASVLAIIYLHDAIRRL